MKNAQEIKKGLAQFYGSQEYYRGLSSKVIFTEGAKYIADSCEAYWLIDAITSHLIANRNLAGQDFILAKLTVKNGKGLLTLDDGNGNILDTQAFKYTDFPLDEITLYAVNDGEYWVILLPSEY